MPTPKSVIPAKECCILFSQARFICPIPGANGGGHRLLNMWTGNGMEPQEKNVVVMLMKENGVLETENHKSSHFWHSSGFHSTLG